jgi:hypothetical protein
MMMDKETSELCEAAIESIEQSALTGDRGAIITIVNAFRQLRIDCWAAVNHYNDGSPDTPKELIVDSIDSIYRSFIDEDER